MLTPHGHGKRKDVEVLAQARLREAMEAADARVKPWQAPVKVGDCFIADSGEEDLLVFGEVLEGYQEAHLRHYRFCRCYSVACPEGEVGDVHVSTVLYLVSRAFFEAMRREGWQMEAGQRPRSACRMMEKGGSAAPRPRVDLPPTRGGLLARRPLCLRHRPANISRRCRASRLPRCRIAARPASCLARGRDLPDSQE